MRTVALSTLWLLFAMPLHASGSQSAMLDYVNQTARAWFQTPEAQEAIAQSNHAHAGLSEEELIELDGVWRAEVGHVDTPVIDAMLDSPLSRALRKSVEDSGGMLTEIILMDNRGMNVAVSHVTSDAWQGDEAKFQETFPKGGDAVHLSDIELDESSQTYQVQVSFVVTTADGVPIGAATIGLNAEAF